jgi:hypothetical protein
VAFTQISSPVISSQAGRHKAMLTSALTWMSDEFDKYIKATDEVPWFYNERAVLGFFISGLLRQGNAIVLQEFSCYKGKDQKKRSRLGRADLYFNFNDVDYLVESKWCCTLANSRSRVDTAVKWANEALSQANRYARDANVKKENIFSLCFEVIYCAEKNYRDYPKNVACWKIKEVNELCGLDFYSVIEVTNDVQKKSYRYKQDLYPALAVYGVFNR